MKINELEKIMSNNNFQENLERQLISEIMERENSEAFLNPFASEKISRKMILTTIIHCTVVLATIMYMLNRREGNT